MSDLEERLFGGNVADSVVRVGATVRKPVTSATHSVEALLEHLFEYIERHLEIWKVALLAGYEG